MLLKYMKINAILFCSNNKEYSRISDVCNILAVSQFV